jgi:GABA(A) receptor-associated protein
MESSFISKVPFEKRRNDAKRIMEKYNDRIPVIVNLGKNTDLPPLDKSKYLVPKDLTFGQLLYVIRTRMKLNPSKALFIFIKNRIPPTSAKIIEIYEEYKELDGFLYCTVNGENTFGNTI